MNDQTPRKVDLALVVGCVYPWRGLNGKILAVISDPFNVTDYIGNIDCNQTCVYVEKILLDDSGHPSCGGNRITVKRLIRIPPDSESKTLFADEPVERGVSV